MVYFVVINGEEIFSSPSPEAARYVALKAARGRRQKKVEIRPSNRMTPLPGGPHGLDTVVYNRWQDSNKDPG